MNSNYFGDLTISFGHLKNIEATSFEREKKSKLSLYFWSCTWKSMRFWLSGAKEVFGNGWSHGKGHSFGNSWSSSRYESPSCSWPHVPGVPPHSRTPRRCGVDVTLSGFSPLQQFHRSNQVLAKVRSVYGQHEDSESSSHLQPHQLQAHRDIALCPTSLTHFWKGCPNGS